MEEGNIAKQADSLANNVRLCCLARRPQDESFCMQLHRSEPCLSLEGAWLDPAVKGISNRHQCAKDWGRAVIGPACNVRLSALIVDVYLRCNTGSLSSVRTLHARNFRLHAESILSNTACGHFQALNALLTPGKSKQASPAAKGSPWLTNK